jgi:N-methylhydantoinase B
MAIEDLPEAPSARRTAAQHDSVAAEILRKAMLNLTNEMALALIRTSGSPIVFEVKDFCTCFMDARGETLSYSAYATVHSGCALVGTKATVAQIRREEIEVRPGDAWILNDPFEAGSAHQGDIAVLTPAFYGHEHLGWCYTSMHVMDIGGVGVSGYAPGAHVVYDEGLRFPPTRAIVGGRIDPEWERFIRANVRMPDSVMGDVRSMMASNNIGVRKLGRVINKFGIDRFHEYCEINKNLTETAFRRRLGKMRDGIYETSEWIEFDGHGGPEHLLELRCRLEVVSDELHFSFAGVPQVPAFINCTEGTVRGHVMAVILTTLGYGDLPFNEGMWRPLKFDVGPPGTIVNAVPPAAVSNGHTETAQRAGRAAKDLLVQALSLSDDPMLRGRVAGSAQDGFPIAGLAGLDQHGEPTIIFLPDPSIGAGGPAQSIHDGQDCYSLSAITGAGLAQVETHESRVPIMFLWRRLMQDSGAPGAFRGGGAMDLAFQLRFSDGVSGSGTNSSAEVPPRGNGGGYPASTGNYWPVYESNVEDLHAKGRTAVDTALKGREFRVPSKTTQLELGRGDVLRFLSGGGSGLGDPLLRDPQRVARDLSERYITAAHAAEAYGVIVEKTGKVDEEATRERRRQIRESRLGRAPAKEQHPPASVGVSIEVGGGGSARAWRCAYCASDLCSTTENWRQASVTNESLVDRYFARLGMHVRARTQEPKMMVAEFVCPDCGGLLHIDVYPAGFPELPAPRIDGQQLPAVQVAAPITPQPGSG